MDSAKTVEDLAKFRLTRERGEQYIVVVDPRTRFEIGLPILHYPQEIKYYRITPPYGVDYWTPHYLCLWEVTPEEVVGVWEWKVLRLSANWYEEIIVPAVERYREVRALEAAERSSQDYSSSESGGGETDEDGSSSSDSAESCEGAACGDELAEQLARAWEDFGCN